MKKLNLLITTGLIFICFLATIDAQNYWKGGTPGKETDWNTAKNWSKNHVPDWTEDVIIPDVSSQSGFFPVIENTIDPIPHLEIQSNAILVVLPKGNLIIDGSITYNSGIYLGGKIKSKGDVIIMNTAFVEIDDQGGRINFENKRLAGN